MANSGTGTNGSDDSRVTGQQWYWTALSAMASYLDAGSIVAIAAGLALWAEFLNLSNSTIGLLAAFGPNAIGAAIGAVIGGRLGDLLGRKRIYQYGMTCSYTRSAPYGWSSQSMPRCFSLGRFW